MKVSITVKTAPNHKGNPRSILSAIDVPIIS